MTFNDEIGWVDLSWDGMCGVQFEFELRCTTFNWGELRTAKLKSSERRGIILDCGRWDFF